MQQWTYEELKKEHYLWFWGLPDEHMLVPEVNVIYSRQLSFFLWFYIKNQLMLFVSNIGAASSLFLTPISKAS